MRIVSGSVFLIFIRAFTLPLKQPVKSYNNCEFRIIPAPFSFRHATCNPAVVHSSGTYCTKPANGKEKAYGKLASNSDSG
jgi:hypothetical protein